jgi:ABC-type uncharacterized transport system ATPase subunit
VGESHPSNAPLGTGYQACNERSPLVMQTTQRPIVLTPLVGLTERERRIVAELLQRTANEAIDRLMKEWQRHTQQEEEPNP